MPAGSPTFSRNLRPASRPEQVMPSDAEMTASKHAIMCQMSCAFFAQEKLRGPEESPYLGRFLIGPHHEEWDKLLVSKQRICVLAPRDHGKTFFFDFAYPLWRIDNEPGGKGYIFSATQDQAARILGDIKDELEDNPKLAHLMPAQSWNATSIQLANGHRIYARGFGTKVRGAHPNWIVVDDGLNDEDAYSEMVRNKHVDYFLTAITNMIVPSGQIIVVGTPYHGSDLYSVLAKNPQYAFRKFPAINADGTALWAARYDAERLAGRKQEIGSVRFTREFMCEPISDDMSLFPERLFRGDPVEQFTVRLGEPMKVWRERGIHSVYMGVDLALSTSTSADAFVIFVIGLDNNGNRWVMDIFTKTGMPFHSQLSAINAMGKKYAADLIYIEANQMQRIYGDELIRTTDLPIRKFVTTGSGKSTSTKFPSGNTVASNKNSLEGGVPALRVQFENSKWRIPRGDANSIELTEAWIMEMKSFAWVDGKLQGVGSHDDLVMSCWIAEQAVRAGGFGFSTGNEAVVESMTDIIRAQTEEPAEGDAEVESVQANAWLNRMIDMDDVTKLTPSSGSLMDDDGVDEEDEDMPPTVDSVWSKVLKVSRTGA